MTKNLFAYTAPGTDFPEFLSINRQADGRITVTVRGPSRHVEGEHGWVTMTLPEHELSKLGDAIECSRLTLPEIAEVRDKSSY